MHDYVESKQWPFILYGCMPCSPSTATATICWLFWRNEDLVEYPRRIEIYYNFGALGHSLGWDVTASSGDIKVLSEYEWNLAIHHHNINTSRVSHNNIAFELEKVHSLLSLQHYLQYQPLHLISNGFPISTQSLCHHNASSISSYLVELNHG